MEYRIIFYEILSKWRIYEIDFISENLIVTWKLTLQGNLYYKVVYI